MDLTLTQEQEMLLKAARDFLATRAPRTSLREIEDSQSGYSIDVWAEMADLGWMGLALPEKYGGAGMKFLDLAILLEEMGRACYLGPFFATVILGAMPILQLGTEKQKQQYLPRIGAGKLVCTMALMEPGFREDTMANKTLISKDGNANSLDGTKLFVPYANIADIILVTAGGKDEGPCCFGVPIVEARSKGIKETLLKNISREKIFELTFDHVTIGEGLLLGEKYYERGEIAKVLEISTVAKCCEMVGGMQQVLDMTTDYAKQRIQYGHPIGSFQAIQHYCANMATDVDAARFSTYHAAWMLSEGIPCTKEVAMAKAWANEAYHRVVSLAHQIHGALGFTMDHDLQFYFRRAKAAEVTCGDSASLQATIAREIALSGSK